MCQHKARQRQLGAPSLQYGAGQVPAIRAFKSLKNKLGEKSELFGLQKHDDRKTNDTSKNTHPQFFRSNPRKLDEEKK